MIRNNGTDLQMRLTEIMGRPGVCKRCGSGDLELFEAKIVGYDSEHMPTSCVREYVCKSCGAHGLMFWNMEFKYNAVPEPWNK